MRLLRESAACLLVAIAALPLPAQKHTPSLDGAWRWIRTEVVSPDSSYRLPVPEGMAVISGHYGSQTWVRPPAAGVQPLSQVNSAEEKVARFDMLTANAWTFELRDSVMVSRFLQSKNPATVGTTLSATFRVRGDSLSLTFQDPWSKDSTKVERRTLVYVRMR